MTCYLEIFIRKVIGVYTDKGIVEVVCRSHKYFPNLHGKRSVLCPRVKEITRTGSGMDAAVCIRDNVPKVR